jgi:hypothetical protein
MVIGLPCFIHNIFEKELYSTRDLGFPVLKSWKMLMIGTCVGIRGKLDGASNTRRIFMDRVKNLYIKSGSTKRWASVGKLTTVVKRAMRGSDAG